MLILDLVCMGDDFILLILKEIKQFGIRVSIVAGNVDSVFIGFSEISFAQ